MEIFLIILIILIVARLCAELAVMCGQPALVGELLAGVLLGYFVHEYGYHFDLSIDFTKERAFTVLTDLGIFFLMLLAGLELSPKDMSESTRSAFGVALGGLLLPFALGILLGHVFIPDSEYKIAQILFIGTAVAITAVPVAVRVLMDVGKLNSRIGRTIISAAVIDDIFSLMLLAILTGIIKSGTLPSLESSAVLVIRVIIFFALCWFIGRFVFPFFGRLLKKSPVQGGGFSGLLIMGLAFALLAELLGLHFIIGAFFAGLLFRSRDVGDRMYNRVEGRISGITSGFLGPLFFASIGLHVTFEAVIETPVFLACLLLVAITGKVLGAGIPAYFRKGDLREAIIIGSAMNGRGAVELIIVEIAMRANLFSHPQPVPDIIANLYSAVVIMAIVTTIMTPVILKPLLDREAESN